jgi:hypothetical protein
VEQHGDQQCGRGDAATEITRLSVHTSAGVIGWLLDHVKGVEAFLERLDG